ncbi:MAG TPA: MG2 domain-containing protein, partial [Saprospiraceae bacterium]|nr:MG2 domain-containing protein [Saprospiraceae bacterium]
MHRTLSPLPMLLLVLGLALLGTALPACKTGSRKDQPNTAAPANSRTDNMALTPLPTPPPGGDYAEEWRIIDSLAAQGLYQSALEKTEALETRARTDARPAQVIKSLIHRAKYTTFLDEDGIVKAIEMLEQRAAAAPQPERAVLYSYLGDLYATYLNNQGWRIRDRTETQPADTPDAPPGGPAGMAPPAPGWLQTASASQIERRALQLHAASVEPLPPVLATPADVYRDILTPSYADTVQGRPLRAHLYDVLASRAIMHFSNDRSYLTEPAYAFALQQPEAFAPVADFVRYPFDSQDMWSGKRLAIKTFQKVLAQYLPGGSAADNAAALIAADLERLQFVRTASTLPDKEARYLQALEALHQKHGDQDMDAEILWYMAQALHFSTEEISDDMQDANDRRAIALLEEAMRRHPGTYGAQMSAVLLRDMRLTTLTVNVEKVNLPNRPALFSVEGANLKTVHVRVVRISSDPADWEKIRRENERNGGISDEQWLKRQTPVQSRSWALVAPDHHRPYRTEIYLDPLPIGNYWLLVSGNGDFDQAEQHEEAFATFSVSNLAVVTYGQGERTVCVAMHRASGAPLAGVKFDFFKKEYRNGREEHRSAGSSVSDASGFAEAKIPSNGGVEGRASLDGDSVWIGWIGSLYRQPDYQPRPQAQFFTDRSIYRPGQTVYFKGVAFQQVGTDSRKLPQILPNQKVTARFYDVNGQPKAMLELRTNEFGTFHGAFTAPSGGLMGNMSIRCDELDGGANFNVEEYKRPKFEVSTLPIQQAFRVNDKIT